MVVAQSCDLTVGPELFMRASFSMIAQSFGFSASTEGRKRTETSQGMLIDQAELNHR
jgi:hypothetical protein